MTDVDTMQALARIELALARIEAVEGGVTTRPITAADPTLPERHGRLRDRVRQTIDRLDLLIAGGGGLMPQVTLDVGGRRYDLACRAGAEPRFKELAKVVDDKARVAAQGLGGVNEARQLLLAGLLLADELRKLKQAPPPPEVASLAPAMAAIAERIEALAERLEKDAPST